MTFKVFAGSLICLTSLVFAENLPSNTSSEDCPQGKKTNRVSVKHIEGGGIGYNQGYTTLEGFFSLNKARVVPFLDARGHVFDNGKFAANAGIGVRGLLTSVVLGANAYYDYRQTHNLHYNQVGMGFEVLGARWEGRINGYLPLGRKQSRPYEKTSITVPSSSPTPFVFDTFNNHFMILSSQTQMRTTKRDKIEFAMKGVDAEVGAHFFSRKEIDLYVGVGPYYFQGYHHKKAIGGKARVTANLTQYLSLSGIYSNDSLFHSRVQGEVALNFSFGPKRLVQKNDSSCESARALQDRLVQPVWRQEIIVRSRKKQKFVSESTSTNTVIAINPATGSPWNFLFVDNTSSSDGTFESPFSNLMAAQNASAPNDVIYVFPGDGTTTGLTSGFVMKTGQQLLGTSLPYSYNTQLGTFSVPAMSTQMPHLASTDALAVTITNDCTVSGLFITSTITAAGSARLSAIGNSTAAFAASVPHVSNPVITNNRIEQAAGFNGECDGIRLANATGLATVSNNQLTGTVSALASLAYMGINLTNFTANCSTQISNNTVSLTGTTATRIYAIQLSSQLNSVVTSQFENNQISVVGTASILGINVDCQTASQHTTLIQNNTFTGFQNGAFNATSIGGNLASAGSVLSGQILSNVCTIHSPGPSVRQTGIDLTLGGASATLLVQNNIISNSFNALEIRNNMIAGSTSTIRVLNNTLNGTTDAVVMTQTTGTLCARYQNNSALSNASSIQFTRTGGTLDLEPLVGNTGTVSRSGTITDVPQNFCGN